MSDPRQVGRLPALTVLLLVLALLLWWATNDAPRPETHAGGDEPIEPARLELSSER